jgi:hypothetical protein
MNEQPSSVVRVLLDERRRLQREIERIDRILAQEGVLDNQATKGAETKTVPDIALRHPNLLTKMQALRKVLEVATVPLAPREMVAEIQRLGYSFTSAHPENTLNPYLYGAKKLPFIKRFGRGFILADRETEFQKLAQPQPPESQSQSSAPG